MDAGGILLAASAHAERTGSVTRLDVGGVGLAARPETNGDEVRMELVDATAPGTPSLAEMAAWVAGDTTWELNGVGSHEASGGSDTYAAQVLGEAIGLEVRVWLGSALVWQGPIIGRRNAPGRVALTCATPEWYFSKRVVGGPARNYVRNGSFERGLAPWSPRVNLRVPSTQTEPPTVTVVPSPTVRGKLALSVLNLGANVDAWVDQTFLWVVDPEEAPLGDRFVLSAYVTLSDTPDAPAYEGRGLYLERFSTTEFRPDYPGEALSLERQFVPFDNVETGKPTLLEVSLLSPVKAGEAEILNVRLYGPAGSIATWDAVALTRDLYLAFVQTDVAEVARKVVEHAQRTDLGKSDLGIPTFGANTGYKVNRGWPWREHANVLSILQELAALENGTDFGVVASPDQRVFVTYGRKGAVKNTRLEWGANVVDFTHTESADQGVSFTFAQAPNNEPDRQEAAGSWVVDGKVQSGAWVDTDPSDGTGEFALGDPSLFRGLTLEDVFQAAEGTDYSDLDEAARQHLLDSRRPESLEVVCAPDDMTTLMGLWPGDVVEVDIQDGSTHLYGWWRILTKKVNWPTRTPAFTLTPWVASA